ncbi:MAG: hypothetical protein P4M00_18945 [Azospirillaceae bacterium]|nr:hypothetical protein [Azospirillaceae bacterium]
MGILLKSMAVVVLALAPLTTALAQSADSGAMAPGGAMMGAGPGMMGPGRMLDPAALSALKDELGITGAQEGQWAAFAAVVTALWDSRPAMPDPAMNAGQMPPPAAVAGGTDVHAVLHRARDALAAVLTPQQRAILDREAPPPPMGPPPSGEPPR